MKYRRFFSLILLILLFISFEVNSSGYSKGDINGDNIVDKVDYVLVRNHIINVNMLTGNALKRADVDESNSIDNRDYVLVRKFALNNITVTPTPTVTPTVTSTPIIEVEKVTLNKTNVTLFYGKTLTLQASISPSNAMNKTITWTSSDTSVATVNKNGKVTGLKLGDAIITATAENGKKAKANIKVKPLTILMVGNSKTYRTNLINKTPSFNFVDLAYNGNYLSLSSDKIVAKVSNNSDFVGVSNEITITAKNGTNLVAKSKSPHKEYITNRTFDIVILQGLPSSKGTVDAYYEDAKSIIDLIGGKNYKGKLYLRTSWPQKNSDLNNNIKNMNSNTEAIAKLINQNYGIKTYVIYDGNAFKKALDNNIEVYVNDLNHQNINGAYLAALCMYVKVYNEDATKVKTNLYVKDKNIASKLKAIANSVCK